MAKLYTDDLFFNLTGPRCRSQIQAAVGMPKTSGMTQIASVSLAGGCGGLHLIRQIWHVFTATVALGYQTQPSRKPYNPPSLPFLATSGEMLPQAKRILRRAYHHLTYQDRQRIRRSKARWPLTRSDFLNIRVLDLLLS